MWKDAHPRKILIFQLITLPPEKRRLTAHSKRFASIARAL
jgi:hypothetical protein